jgi:hypothetical protein
MPIRGILIGNEDLAITMCKKLHDRGFATTVAMYPTVEEGHAILRCALSALHRAGKSTTSIKTSENHWLKPQNSCCRPAKSGRLRTMTHMKGTAFPLREPLSW